MVMTLKGQAHRSKQMTPSDSLTPKTYLDAKIVILSALVRKLWSKTSFCIMVANVKRVRVRHTFKPLKIFFDLLKGPDPSYLVLKFGNTLSTRNRDMAQNVILHSCDLDRSRSQVKINGTIDFLDLKNIDLDTKIFILSALVQKL